MSKRYYDFPSTDKLNYEQLKSLIFILKGIVKNDKSKSFLKSVYKSLQRYGNLSVKQLIVVDEIRKQYSSFFKDISKQPVD